MPLDDLEEHRRAIFNGFGEDLQQISFFVAIYQDTQFGQLIDWLVDLAYTFLKHVIVGRGYAQELDPVIAQLAYRVDNASGGHGDMLHTGAVIEIKVFLDLRFLLALGWLVDREFDFASAV